ncbi:MAG: GTPase domain-containing protein [Myxococcota bacterium]
MPDLSWDMILTKGASLPIQVYQNRRRLWALWSWLGETLDTAYTRIVVTGRPRAGKSTLFQHMIGSAASLDWQKPNPSTGPETYRIPVNEWDQIIRIVPGQQSSARTHALDAAFDSPHLKGIIHVVDWGFNLPRDDVARKILSQSLIDAKGVDDLTALRIYNQEAECREFEKICDRARNYFLHKKRRLWMAVVATKADLYRAHLTEAQRYYDPDGDSPFSSLIRRLHLDVGRLNVPVIAVPVAPHPEAFVWGSTELGPQILGEDDRRQLLQHLLTRIGEVSR